MVSRRAKFHFEIHLAIFTCTIHLPVTYCLKSHLICHYGINFYSLLFALIHFDNVINVWPWIRVLADCAEQKLRANFAFKSRLNVPQSFRCRIIIDNLCVVKTGYPKPAKYHVSRRHKNPTIADFVGLLPSSKIAFRSLVILIALWRAVLKLVGYKTLLIFYVLLNASNGCFT